MQNEQHIAETSSNNFRNDLLLEIEKTPERYIPELLEIVRLFRQSVMLKQASSQQWENAINQVNHSDVVKQQERKSKIKHLFDSWNELETQEEQEEILEIIKSVQDVSI